MADFAITNHGTIMLLTPLTPEAKAWVEANIPEDAQFWGNGAVVVEPRYMGEIVEGFCGDGLTWEGE